MISHPQPSKTYEYLELFHSDSCFTGFVLKGSEQLYYVRKVIYEAGYVMQTWNYFSNKQSRLALNGGSRFSSLPALPLFSLLASLCLVSSIERLSLHGSPN